MYPMVCLIHLEIKHQHQNVCHSQFHLKTQSFIWKPMSTTGILFWYDTVGLRLQQCQTTTHSDHNIFGSWQCHPWQCWTTTMRTTTVSDYANPLIPPNWEQVHANDIHQWGQRNCYLTSQFVYTCCNWHYIIVMITLELVFALSLSMISHIFAVYLCQASTENIKRVTCRGGGWFWCP